MSSEQLRPIALTSYVFNSFRVCSSMTNIPAQSPSQSTDLPSNDLSIYLLVWRSLLALLLSP